MLGCNSNTVECIHHITFYMVGYVALQILRKVVWRDLDAWSDCMFENGGLCLPEHIDLDAMSNQSAGKFQLTI